VQQLWQSHDLDSIDRIGIASVVPPLTRAMQDAATRQSKRLLLVHHKLQLPFTLGYETPHTLGTDRLAAAVAAWQRYGTDTSGAPRSVVAIDAGTALTYEVIDRHGTYRGGAIGAGPDLMRRALNSGTAQLPAVAPEVPARAIGRSTHEALQAGIMLGFVDSVRGMLHRIANELEDDPYVLITGGWSGFLHEHLPAVDAIEPHLVLLGIRDLLALNDAPSST
jgi:type III pantothenate kinase